MDIIAEYRKKYVAVTHFLRKHRRIIIAKLIKKKIQMEQQQNDVKGFKDRKILLAWEKIFFRVK